jgi:hypothetical protein
LPWKAGTPRSLTAEELKEWWARIELSETYCAKFHPQWERGLTRYAKALVEKQPTDVNALLDYRHVESKKSDLFYRTPDVTLVPIDPVDPQVPADALLPLRQKFLNHDIGPKGANAKRALHKTLIDALAASGWMTTVVGVEQVKLPDPMTGQMIPIWAKRFIASISSKKALIPADFTDSSNFDAAPWLAYKGCMPVSQARRAGWQIPDDVKGSTQADSTVYKHAEAGREYSDPQLEYVLIWLKASLFDEAVFNPELYRCLVLVKGLKTAAWYIDSPFQDLDDTGQLTADSMVGNPIHMGTLRDLIDSAIVPSDLVMGEQLSVEVNKFREGLIGGRKARRNMTLVSDALGEAKAEKLWKDGGGVVPENFIGENGSQRIVAIVQAGSEPRDNYTAQDYAERDYTEALGMNANQRGQVNKKRTTATEARIVQGNASARIETEKDRIREYFVALVRKYDVVVQRTAVPKELAQVLGQQGAKVWDQWRVWPGRYGYDVLPDSGAYVDIHQARSEWLQKYELLRRDDRVNTDDLLAEGARLWNRDPAKFMVPPVDKTLEPPKMSVGVNLIDLNDPVAGRVYLDLAANSGVKHAADTIELLKKKHGEAELAQAAGVVGANGKPNEHGGAALKAERLNKHQEQKTGAVQGVGVQ